MLIIESKKYFIEIVSDDAGCVVGFWNELGHRSNLIPGQLYKVIHWFIKAYSIDYNEFDRVYITEFKLGYPFWHKKAYFLTSIPNNPDKRRIIKC